MDFKGKAKRLDDIDLPRIGAQIGVGEDEIHAVLDVETRGGGFDSQGRPKMLFEPHVFYRELERYPVAREAAMRAGLAYRRWGERKYPRESYSRFKEALKLCQRHSVPVELAYRSASWGLGQIMGFNHEAAGYLTARMMVSDFLNDEERHLEAMVKFIVAKDLDDDLRNHDWAGFARGYNGAGYAKHGYHLKLARAYAKWSKISDTPFEINREPDIEPAVPSLFERLAEALAVLFAKGTTA